MAEISSGGTDPPMEQGGTEGPSVCRPNGGGGGESQAGNHGVSEKVRRQDATDRDEVGEHRRVNPKVQGGDQGVQGTLAPHPSLPHLDSFRGAGEKVWGQRGEEEAEEEEEEERRK